MTLAQRIKEYRTRLQFTQEELAMKLHVSHAAVSKWETGVTCPDIKLLPILARVLHTDVNTLLDFTNEVSDEEIALFLNEVSELARKDYVLAHHKVEEKLQEYPHCDKLMYSCAMILYGNLMNDKFAGYESYKGEVIVWMNEMSESFDPQIRYCAKQFLIGVYRSEKRFDQAEALLHDLPNISGIDPERMKVMLEQDKGNIQEAEVLCENMILSLTNRLFSGLEILLELRCDAKRIKEAEKLAIQMEQFANSMELWEYHAAVPHFCVAVKTSDESKIISSLQRVLKACDTPWKLSGSLLYSHVKSKPFSKEFSIIIKQELLQGLLEEECGTILKKNPEFLSLCQDNGVNISPDEVDS